MSNHLLGNKRKAVAVSGVQAIGRSRRCFIVGAGSSEPPPCVDITLGASSHNITGADGDTITPYTIPVTAGTTPYTFELVSGELAPDLALDPDTGIISGTLSTPGTYLGTVRVSNECPSEAFIDIHSTVTEAPPTPSLIRWGNVTFDDGPSPLPTVNEAFFLSPTIFIPVGATSPGTLTGSYTFPAGDGVHQLMFVADSLLTSGTYTFKVGAADWGLTPGANTPAGSVTVAGVAGKWFYTAFQNNGGQVVDATA